jgi:pimeloyl-ACP methyl ester carboxylesterase
MSICARTVPAQLLALSVVLAACGTSPSSSIPSASAAGLASAASSPSTVAGLPLAAADDLYYPSAEAIATTGAGEIMRAIEIRAAAGMRAWFVIYGSTGLDGEPVAVSGMILAPEEAPSGDGYPVVAWAHPTTGVADGCAPSKAGVDGIPAEVQGLVAQGYVVAATDYEGLGTDGVHPYLVGISEGRSVLDSIRATQHLVRAHAGTEAVVIGLSQGGHAALWSAELAPAYAPGLTLLGALAGSPPTDLAAWDTWAFHQAAAGSLDPAAAPLLLFGVWNGIYDAPLSFLTNEGRQSALAGREGCEPTRINRSPYVRDPAEIAEWSRLLARNSPGGTLTGVPIRVVSPRGDQAVQYDSQVAGVEAMCEIGDTVELVSIDGNHDDSVSPPAAWADVTAWITDRFAGADPLTTCSPSSSPAG